MTRDEPMASMYSNPHDKIERHGADDEEEMEVVLVRDSDGEKRIVVCNFQTTMDVG